MGVTRRQLKKVITSVTTKKVASFFRKNRGDTVSCPAPGDTNPSDAAAFTNTAHMHGEF